MHEELSRVFPGARTAVFTLEESEEKGRPFINIDFQTKDGRWSTIRALADAGNDITLLSERDALKLGFNKGDGRPFRVAGISGVPQQFYMVDTYIRIGRFEPTPIRMGFGPVRDNLLGREDIFPYFNIIYSPGHITFLEYTRHYNALAAMRTRFR